jgi:hydroxymethylbilane synthase
MVAGALEEAHGWPTGTVIIHPVRTSGDRIQDRPLAEVGGKALWTKELDLALLAGETDCSVHSMKDVESQRPETLLIAAMLKRADARDRLIGAGSLGELREGAIVGTSSPRRSAQLRRLRPDIRTISIRGNVDTRLAKQASGDIDATLLAAAGLDRLGRQEVGVAIDLSDILPAPAQGAIGIECRANDVITSALLKAIDHSDTHQAVLAERAFCRALGGTCHSPVAAYARTEGEQIHPLSWLDPCSTVHLRRSAVCSRGNEEAAPASPRAWLVGKRGAGGGNGAGGHCLPPVPGRGSRVGRAQSRRLRRAAA